MNVAMLRNTTYFIAGRYRIKSLLKLAEHKLIKGFTVRGLRASIAF